MTQTQLAEARPSVPPLTWMRPPRQARSARTLERLLDAAEDLVIERGMRAVTIQDVVQKAQSSVGAFYARFSDKDALMRTLFERSCDQAVATADDALDPARWSEVPLGEAIDRIAEFVVRVFQDRAGLVMASSAAVATEAAYATRAAELHRHIGASMHRLLVARCSEISHPDLELASTVVVRVLLATLEQDTILARVTPPERALSRRQLADQLARILLGYLGVKPDGSNDADRGDQS